MLIATKPSEDWINKLMRADHGKYSRKLKSEGRGEGGGEGAEGRARGVGIPLDSTTQ